MTKSTWKIIALPLIFLGITLSLALIWNIFDWPKGDELIAIAKNYFDRYGLVTIFISAIIEGMLLVGWYYPGSAVIFLGVVFAGKNVGHAAEVMLVVICGLSMAYCINFILGKYGWYRLLLAFGLKESIDGAKLRLTKYGMSGIFIGYWQPNFAALTSTAAGILHLPFRMFIIFSLAAAIFWSTFWGVIVYHVGTSALSIFSIPVILSFIALWIVFIVIKKKKSSA